MSDNIIHTPFVSESMNGKAAASLPLSKSIALRVLTLNAVSRSLGNGEAFIPNLPDSDDVKGMLRALSVYAGLCDAKSSSSHLRHIVNIGEGGAPFRFFTALAASTPGVDLTLLAKKSLIRRPLGILLEALRDAGADISCIRRPERPPLHIRGLKITGGMISMDPSVSSQFVSALMMVAPLWRDGLHLHFEGGTPVSAPYIRMTARIMRLFGCDVTLSPQTIQVEPGICTAPETISIEPDWSAASYFYEYALLSPGTPVCLAALTPPSASSQGDSRCAEIFAAAGVDTRIHPDGSATLTARPERVSEIRGKGEILEFDMNDTPDLVPALAVAFCSAGLKWRFTSVGHLKHKETDRMAALGAELAKLGFTLRLGGEVMEWDGTLTTPLCDGQGKTRIKTYSDHRMAMAFAPAALKFPGLIIENPEVVAKSFPDFFTQLQKIRVETN